MPRPSRPPKPPQPRKARGGNTLFGCLIFLVIGGGIVLMAVGAFLWGETVWRWADDAWPGGVHAFAVVLGSVFPALVWAFAFSGFRVNSGAGKGRSPLHLSAAVLEGIALVLLLSLVVDTWPPSGRGSSSPSWVFDHHPWVCGTGLAATLAAAAALVVGYIRVSRRAAS
ncbi:hypothetical protein [Streptomyces sp. NBC_01361]|uniref:hypothetical protein n=1 Tax=Streptomyces sp. NBC_01361 TaxID=2903838 RepID=UPI002E33FA48|nr:hypothetical protein [Streptomyces sp. NBC_01361]